MHAIIRKTRLPFIGAIGLLVSAGVACSSSGNGDGSSFGGGGATGSGGSGGTRMDGGGGVSAASGAGGGLLGRPCVADTDCGTDEFCSVTQVCTPDGSCGSDGDCVSGEYCSSTRECIPLGTCTADADCAEVETCDPNGACVPGDGCGGQEFGIEIIAPNMFIVLDRSCSMRRDLTNTINLAGPNKWTFAVAAINQLTTNFDGQIRWGLSLFPDRTGGDCRQDAPAVPLADGMEPTIQGLLNAALNQSDTNYPDGPCVTNIDTAVEQASQQPDVMSVTRPTYVLLITDGKQAGCSRAGGDSGTEMILASMFAGGVPTFVVGFGDAGSGGVIDPVQMDAFAVAGGVPRSGTPKYFQADDALQLDQALALIAGSIVGCNFTLSDTPADPADVFVFFDDQKVTRDPSGAEGWDYDGASNSITFYGSACDSLKAGQVVDVDVVFGCDEPTPF